MNLVKNFEISIIRSVVVSTRGMHRVCVIVSKELVANNVICKTPLWTLKLMFIDCQQPC